MCKFGKLFSRIGLISILLGILIMLVGWFLLNIRVCVISFVLMCIAAASFILCMICNCTTKVENEATT